MTIIGHTAIPMFVYIVGSKTLNHTPTLGELILIGTFSNFPDIDFLFQFFRKNKKFGQTFQHHNWPTHWPIVYVPILLTYLVTQQSILGLFVYGVFFHLILDSLSAGDGIMWFYPVSKKFSNFFSSKTNGKHGKNWLNVYVKTINFKIEIVFLFATIFLALSE